MLLQAPRKFITRTATTLHRGFTQAFRCFSIYQSRLVLGVLIALVYGGTYSHLNLSFQGLQERLSLLFIISAILPLLTLGALPIFAHNDKVQLTACWCVSSQLSDPASLAHTHRNFKSEAGVHCHQLHQPRLHPTASLLHKQCWCLSKLKRCALLLP